MPAPRLHNADSLRSYFADLAEADLYKIVVMCIISGCLLMMSLFGWAQYLFRKERVYIFYTLFCLVGCLSLIWNANYMFGIGLPLEMRSANQLFAFAITILYSFFIKNMITLPPRFTAAWKILDVMLLLLLMQACLSVWEFFNGLAFRSDLYYRHISHLIVACNIFLFLCLLAGKSPVKWFLVAGAACLWLPNLLVDLQFSELISNKGVRDFILYSINGAAIFLENIFFLLAIAYRNYLAEKEKDEIQSQYASRLQSELQVITREIEEKQRILEEQKLSRLQDHLKQQVTEMEIAALKAQMNPHFLFNCINSIDAFIHSNDKYNATLYLNKFAKLIRNVLDSSRENTVSFSKDIETLKLYVELEELRSGHTFTFGLMIDPELLDGDYKVPPLIVQPFVENAIIHGLRNKETGGGLLSVEISKDDQYIMYRVQDNGVGRKAAHKDDTQEKRSYGMEMSYERIRLFNQEATASAQVTDLYREGEPAGTEIIIRLKII